MNEQQEPTRRAPDDLPRSPTGRIPQWVIDEAEGRETSAASWRHGGGREVPLRGAHERPAGRARRAGRPDSSRGLVVLGALVFVGTATAILLSGWSPFAPQGPVPTAAGPAAATAPPVGSGEEPAPLGTPEPFAASAGDVAYLFTQPDGVTPVAYDPCRPIHYVVRPDNAPARGRELLGQAFDRISRATGLVFVDDGTTTEAASMQRPAYAPDRYGDRWAPVLVVWETTDENPDFVTDVLGEAGSLRVQRPVDGMSVYVTGQVRLDAAQFAQVLEEPDGETVARAAMIHELGHLVGLDHVTDPKQIMYPETRLVADLGAGDLVGLAKLGTGACFPDV